MLMFCIPEVFTTNRNGAGLTSSNLSFPTVESTPKFMPSSMLENQSERHGSPRGVSLPHEGETSTRSGGEPLNCWRSHWLVGVRTRRCFPVLPSSAASVGDIIGFTRVPNGVVVFSNGIEVLLWFGYWFWLYMFWHWKLW